MDTENQKSFRFKVGDEVYSSGDDCLYTIYDVDFNDDLLPYRIENVNGDLFWTMECELVSKEVYESPLFKIMQEVEND